MASMLLMLLSVGIELTTCVRNSYSFGGKSPRTTSSFCCDVIGDICGVISGAAGTTICAILVTKYHTDLLLTGLILTAIISSLTIGGKALGKSFAINKSDIILYEFSKFVSNFYH